MLTVHHLNASRSHRIIWLLEELEIPYNMVKHQRDKETRLSPQSLKEIHPLGKAPIIVDDNIILCESGAIVEYILEKDEQARLRPRKSSQDYARYLQWLHFAEGSLSLPLISTLFLKREERDGKQALDRYIAKEIEVDFAYIESTLSAQDYFAGDSFSAADIMMTFMLELADRVGVLGSYPKAQAYLTRVQSRSAYIKASSLN